MSEECKELEKKAKELEADNVEGAIKAYQQAAKCYAKSDKPKNRIGCLGKAAKLIRDNAKSIDDPVKALDTFNSAAQLYKEMGKDSEAEKVVSEANKKFVDSAKALRIEAKKDEDPKEAELKLIKASDFASRGKDDVLSKICWVDSGEQFRKKAGETENPREAFAISQHAIKNFEKGGNEELKSKSLTEAAEKFNKRAIDIEKSKKNLILAIDGYTQAATLFKVAKISEKEEALRNKINEICEFIGIPLENIQKHLISKDIIGISI